MFLLSSTKSNIFNVTILKTAAIASITSTLFITINNKRIASIIPM